LPIILFIGFITSFEDFKEFKIKNKWVIFGLSYAFLIYFFVFIFNQLHLLNPWLNLNFDKWCINFIISSLTAYLLWNFKMWGAGDAKLFICFAALIPVGQYSRVYFNHYFASFSLLVAIFIPATIFLIARSGIYFLSTFNFRRTRNENQERVVIKSIKFRIIEIIKILVGFFLFFLFFKVLNKWLYGFFGSKITDYRDLPVFISLLAFKPLSTIFNKNIKFIIFALIILIMYVIFGMAYTYQQFILEIMNILGRTALVMILFPALRRIVELYTERVAQKTTPFAIWIFLGVLLVWFL
jgi:hypothetical protein